MIESCAGSTALTGAGDRRIGVGCQFQVPPNISIEMTAAQSIDAAFEDHSEVSADLLLVVCPGH